MLLWAPPLEDEHCVVLPQGSNPTNIHAGTVQCSRMHSAQPGSPHVLISWCCLHVFLQADSIHTLNSCWKQISFIVKQGKDLSNKTEDAARGTRLETDGDIYKYPNPSSCSGFLLSLTTEKPLGHSITHIWELPIFFLTICGCYQHWELLIHSSQSNSALRTHPLKKGWGKFTEGRYCPKPGG